MFSTIFVFPFCNYLSEFPFADSFIFFKFRYMVCSRYNTLLLIFAAYFAILMSVLILTFILRCLKALYTFRATLLNTA